MFTVFTSGTTTLLQACLTETGCDLPFKNLLTNIKPWLVAGDHVILCMTYREPRELLSEGTRWLMCQQDACFKEHGDNFSWPILLQREQFTNGFHVNNLHKFCLIYLWGYIMPSVGNFLCMHEISGTTILVSHFFFLWLYSPIQALATSVKLSVSFQLLDLRQSVGLLAQVINSSQFGSHCTLKITFNNVPNMM
jgi:hypothetical protein